MSTTELQRSQELTHAADMAVRVSSQLRLWLVRKETSDKASFEFAVDFLEQAINGGRFIESQAPTSGSSSLGPLTWSADLYFGSVLPDTQDDVDYGKLIEFVSQVKSTVELVLSASGTLDEKDVSSAAEFFRGLGKYLGALADGAISAPLQRMFMTGDRYSL